MSFKPVVYRQLNGYDTKKVSDETAIVNDEPSLTVQSMTEDTDINLMLKRYGIGAKMPEAPRLPMYGDFTKVRDFQSALNAVMEAQDGFMELPAGVRERFENDPQKMLEFLDNSENVDEAIKLGLLSEKAMGDRKAYWEADKASRHAQLIEAARAAGLEFAPAKPAEPAVPAAPSKT